MEPKSTTYTSKRLDKLVYMACTCITQNKTKIVTSCEGLSQNHLWHSLPLYTSPGQQICDACRPQAVCWLAGQGAIQVA